MTRPQQRKRPKNDLARRARQDEREEAAFAAGVCLPEEACGTPVCVCVWHAGVRLLEHPRCPLHGNGETWQLAQAYRCGLVHSE